MSYIYSLSDPRTDEVRYVGKTESLPRERLRSHLQAHSRKSHTHKNHWINNLLDNKLKPVIEVIEEVEPNLLNETEKFYIEYFRSLGFKLTNTTPGGDGQPKGVKFSAAVRAKMSAAHIGKKLKPFTEEHKRRIALVNIGRRASTETRAKMSASRIGGKRSEATKALMSASAMGKKFSRASIEKSAATRMKAVQDDSGRIFKSVTEAAATIGVRKSSVSASIKYNRPCKGLTFSFIQSQSLDSGDK